jgi:hypothetical protein
MRLLGAWLTGSLVAIVITVIILSTTGNWTAAFIAVGAVGLWFGIAAGRDERRSKS